MLLHPSSRSEPGADDFHPLPKSDLVRILEQHILAGFPSDLALDLVLNEFVVRAADLTHASAAALALVREDEMVCRAATGLHAPDLGIPLNTQDGLSGACVRTRLPQLCTDAESDPRVDPAVSRRLGIRSMLVVPVFETGSDDLPDASPSLSVTSSDSIADRARSTVDKGGIENDPLALANQPKLAGVLEVFSPLANAFPESAQSLLVDFARECARIHQTAGQMRNHPTAPEFRISEAQPVTSPPGGVAAGPLSNSNASQPLRIRQPYEGWAIALGSLVIIAAAGISFLIGSRIGWLRFPGTDPASANRSNVQSSSSEPPSSAPSAGSPGPSRKRLVAKAPTSTKVSEDPALSSNELVVYEKGKVVFRMKPVPAAEASASRAAPSDTTTAYATLPDHTAASSPVIPAASSTRIAPVHTVWLAPAQADNRLLTRVEPEYPPDALAAHRSGNVVLEVHVAEDGTVSSVRTLSGDPLLAPAATQAVRNWRYQPYRPHEQPSPFQTDVTLTFSLPN